MIYDARKGGLIRLFNLWSPSYMFVIDFRYKTVGNCGKNIARLATNLNNEISRSKELNDYLIKFDVTIRICCTQKPNYFYSNSLRVVVVVA